MMVKTIRRWSLLLMATAVLTGYAQSGNYEAPRAATAPVIDGVGNDACWAMANWYTQDQVWLGAAPTAADFTGKFKITWDADKLYVLGEVVDDVLNDNFADPLENYWEDDTWEVFIDENKSGGDHQTSYNAFAYHISKALDAVDIGTDGNPKLLNSHVNVKRTAVGNTYTWEAAFDVYTDKFVFGAANNVKAVLEANKVMGFAMAYCDNDGGSVRQSFIGSEVIAGTDKNQAYKNASVFGKLTLVNSSTPQAGTFSSVLVANNLSNPSAMVCAPDGRIFICEQTGKLRIFKNGALLPTAAISLDVDLTSDGTYTERGLLGITLDPLFTTNGHIYLYYTTASGGKHNRVSRFTMKGDVALSEETIIIDLDPLSGAINHNGGAMNFGKDGKLYIAVGDNKTPQQSQDLDTYHGKILRINPDGSAPTDNPFYEATASEQKKRIWSYGVRNPFTFDVHPTTGQILLNEVGQDMWEEIDDATLPGKNYGWPTVEGMSTNANFTNPVYAYSHTGITDTTGCAITGGTFFTPDSTNYPSKYRNMYFFMDFCGNWMNALDTRTGKITKFYKGLAGSPVVVDMGIDGNLYYLSRDNSSIYKIMYSGSAEPHIVTQPISQTVFETQTLSLSVAAIGGGTFNYQWQKNGIDIANANSPKLIIADVTPADSGLYTVIVSNIAGSVTSDAAKITIGPKNSKPVAAITSPSDGILYKAGDSFNFSGTATDEEDGILPASAFVWFLDFHHDTHMHDGPPIATGRQSGTITIPVTGETSDTVWYVLKLIVTDSKGLKDTATIELLPKKSTLTFQTQPAGLRVSVDNQIYVAPKSILSVQNLQRHLKPITPQVLNGVHYKFEKWLHGGAVDQMYSTPTNSATVTAVYESYVPDTVTLTTIADAYIQDGKLNAADSTTAFGASNPTQLVSKIYSQGPNRRILLRFDISSYNADIKAAKIKLFGGIEQTEYKAGDKIKIAVYTSTDNTWDEKTVTWKTKPAHSTAFLDTITVNNVSTTNKNYLWDVTNYVKQAKAANQTTINFVLINTRDLYPRVIFHSKENTSGNAPKLVIVRNPLISQMEEVATIADNNVVQVYPNPSHEGFNVIIPASAQVENAVLKNLLGATIAQPVLHTGHTFGAQLPLGVYILEYKINGQAQRLKIVKE